jgi:hypothetical protein
VPRPSSSGRSGPDRTLFLERGDTVTISEVVGGHFDAVSHVGRSLPPSIRRVRAAWGKPGGRGDHTVFVAEVVSTGVRDSSKVPLVLRSTGLNYGG